MLGEISEGFEETISNSLETAFTDISISINKNYIYDIKETLGGKEFKLFQDTFGSWFSEESKESFLSGCLVN